MPTQRQSLPLKIAFPDLKERLEQNEEWFFLYDGDKELKIYIHDYGKIFNTQGLYELLMCNYLRCISHHKIVHMIIEEVLLTGGSLEDLIVLDIGAGNGLVGEELYRNSIRSIIGIDKLEEATIAIKRDRPEVYRDVYVMDMSELTERNRKRLVVENFNLLTCGSAMDFSDIPPIGFANAFNLLVPNAWFVFNIKGEKDLYTEKPDEKGNISAFISHMMANNIASVLRCNVYQHRLSIDGRPIIYTAVLGRKLNHLSISELID